MASSIWRRREPPSDRNGMSNSPCNLDLFERNLLDLPIGPAYSIYRTAMEMSRDGGERPSGFRNAVVPLRPARAPMRLWQRLRERLQRSARRPTPDHVEFDDEIRAHLELSAREQMLDGADAETARRRALESFGDLETVRQSMQRVWSRPWSAPITTLWQRIRRHDRI